jgi:hypothetical protein
MSLCDSGDRPLGLLAEQLVFVIEEWLCERSVRRSTGVPERDERVPAKVAAVVPRDIQAVEPLAECIGI